MCVCPCCSCVRDTNKQTSNIDCFLLLDMLNIACNIYYLFILQKGILLQSQCAKQII